jgi:hypothetical protein
VIVAAHILALGYGFEGIGNPLRSFEMLRRFAALHGMDESHRLLQMPAPLPRSYVNGVLALRAVEEDHADRWCFLAGSHRRGGWWYYFVVATLLKMPSGTLFLMLLASVLGRPTREELTLLLPAAVIFLMASASTLQIGLRYVLPAFGLMTVYTGRAFRCDQHGWRTLVKWSAVIVTVTASLSTIPNWIGFFNSPARALAQPEEWLVDSNLDWGQDLYALRKWWQSQDHDGTLTVAYFGGVPAEAAGFETQIPPVPRHFGLPQSLLRDDRFHVGWYAFSVNFVTAFDPAARQDHLGFTPSANPIWKVLGAGQPDYRVGSSILVFHLDESEAALLNETFGL